MREYARAPQRSGTEVSEAAARTPIRIGVVHGSRLIAEGLRDLLGHESTVSVTAVHLDLASAAREPIPGPHILLADLSSVRAAGMAGIGACLSAAPEAKILVFDVEDDDAAIIECVRAGTAGCVLRDASPAELVAAILFEEQLSTTDTTTSEAAQPDLKDDDAKPRTNTARRRAVPIHCECGD